MGAQSKYQPEMCAVVLDLMRDGASLVEVSAELGIHRDTFYKWIDDKSEYYHEEFGKAVSEGKLLSQAWWERNGRINLTNKDFSYTGWYMNMKNRFGWADKQEVSGPGGGPIKQAFTVEFIDSDPESV